MIVSDLEFYRALYEIASRHIQNDRLNFLRKDIGLANAMRTLEIFSKCEEVIVITPFGFGKEGNVLDEKQ